MLLVGDMMDSGGQDTVPVAARKALADMKDFLPYKSYRLIDTQWVLGSNSGPAIVRLRGWEEQEYGSNCVYRRCSLPAARRRRLQPDRPLSAVRAAGPQRRVGR